MFKQDADAFQSAIAQTPDLWRSLHFRAVAIWARGAWHNLVASAHLDARPPEKVPLAKDLPKLERLVAVQEVFPIATLPKLIQRLRLRGSVDLSGTTVNFLSGGYENLFTRPYTSTYQRIGLSLDWYIQGDFLYGHAFSAHGDTISELTREFPGGENGIDVALRREGWHSLNELVLRGLGDLQTPSPHSARRLVFVAPIEVALANSACSLRGGELRYSVIAGSREAAQRATLTVTGLDARGARIARTLVLESKRWGQQKRIIQHSGTLRLPKVQKVELTLHAAGYECGQVTLTDDGKLLERPSLLMLAHEALFSGPRSFQEVLLTPKDSEGRPFERAVAKLFGYCGFPTDQPGDVPQEQNGPDVLVEVSSRNLLLVIETTVKQLMNDDGKMNRLTKRAADIRRAVKHLDVVVAPVMVVPWSRETLVPVEMAQAENNGVRVLGNEDLAAILSLALSHRPIREIAHYIVPEARPTRKRSFLPHERNPLADEPQE